jgi:hypothetical protein
MHGDGRQDVEMLAHIGVPGTAGCPPWQPAFLAEPIGRL